MLTKFWFCSHSVLERLKNQLMRIEIFLLKVTYLNLLYVLSLSVLKINCVETGCRQIFKCYKLTSVHALARTTSSCTSPVII